MKNQNTGMMKISANMTIDDALQQAVNHHQAGQLQEAERRYRGILETQPNHPEANHNLGVLALQVGQPAAGLPYLKNAWKLNPHHEQFCLTLTECLLALDCASDALRVIGNAMRRKGFKSMQASRLLQQTTHIAEGKWPPPTIAQEVANSLNAGHHAALEERLAALLSRYPDWRAGWDMLCTVRQIQGKDGEVALQRALELLPDHADAANQRKVFCIGANKTGTTSVEKVFSSLGLTVGNQGQAELLVHDWARQDYRRLIGYCRFADAFQDVPFSLPGTFQAMDTAFPGSKFVLTVRNSAVEWFESLLRFHSKIVGKGRVPTADDLRQFNYRYPGFLFDSFRLRYGADESNLYNRDLYIQKHEVHNHNITEYFRGRPDDLLVLNVGEPDAMERLLIFLGYPYTGQKMPHLNSSKD